MKRTFLALALCLGLLTCWASAFTDVAPTDWYYASVEDVVSQGLMQGTGGDVFSPEGVVNRGVVVVTLWRLAQSPAAAEAAAFTDVSPEDWYAEAAAWGSETGIVTGYDDGTFSGNAPVSREQLAVFLYRYCQYAGMELAEGYLGGYQDEAQVSCWAVEGMNHAVGAGLMTGVEGNLLSPKGTTTRAQLAVVLQRLTTPVVG